MTEQDIFNQLLQYDPSTGYLFWRERDSSLFKTQGIADRWNNRYAGTRAFTAINSVGYHTGNINNKGHRAQRVIWTMAYGLIPNGMVIDHIDGIRTNNKLTNLRLVDREGNSRNSRRSAANKSGFTGVCYEKRRDKWMVTVGIGGGKSKFIGYFDDISDAVEARSEASIMYQYHPNHGSVR